MKKQLYVVGLCSLVGVMGLCGAGRTVEELQVYLKKETIGGTVFEYREDLAAGTRKETWSINGRPVTAYDYENAVLEAEKELRRQERHAELERRRARQEGQLNAVRDLQKKLVRLNVEQVEAVLARCKDPRLAPFLQFGARGELSKAEFDAIPGALESAKRLLSSADDDSVGLLKAALEKLEALPDRLDGLIQASLDHAIKYCNDTKMLKELLGMAPLG